MAKRIVSTILLWALVICSLVFFRTEGGVALITLISVLTLREFYKLMQGAGLAPFDKLGMTFGALITIAPWLEAKFDLPATLGSDLAHILLPVRATGRRSTRGDWCPSRSGAHPTGDRQNISIRAGQGSARLSRARARQGQGRRDASARAATKGLRKARSSIPEAAGTHL